MAFDFSQPIDLWVSDDDDCYFLLFLPLLIQQACRVPPIVAQMCNKASTALSRCKKMNDVPFFLMQGPVLQGCLALSSHSDVF